MKKTVVLFLSMLLIFTGAAQNHTVKIEPAKPKKGKKVTISYLGPLVKEGSEMVLYSFSNSCETKFQIPTVVKNNQLVANHIMPDSLNYIAVNIIHDGKEEKTGFGFHLYTKSKISGESYIDEALTRFRQGEIEMKDVKYRIEKAFQSKPKLKKKRIMEYVSAKRYLGEEIELQEMKLVGELFQQKVKKRDEKNLDYIIYFLSDLGYDLDIHKQDSLQQIAIKRMPKGEVNRTYLFERVMMAESLDSALNYYVKYEGIYGVKGIAGDNMNKKLAMMYCRKSDYNNFEKYISLVVLEDLSADGFNIAANQLLDNDHDLDRAKAYSLQAIEALDKYLASDEFQSESESWKAKNYSKQSSYWNTYAAALMKLGSMEEALMVQRKAVNGSNREDRSINKQFLNLLLANNLPEEALQVSEKLIVTNQSDANIESIHKEAYLAVYGNTDNLESALASLSEEQNKDFIETIKSKMFHKAIPDMQNNMVNLNDYKGKIIILDFWATWCMPCLRSFPAMQKAIQSMEGKQVEFLFINTFEDEEEDKILKKIEKEIGEKGYDFKVLLDSPKTSVAAKAYGVNMIPTKIFIDTHGNIRYISEGFESEEKLLKEIDAIVQILSDEK